MAAEKKKITVAPKLNPNRNRREPDAAESGDLLKSYAASVQRRQDELARVKREPGAEPAASPSRPRSAGAAVKAEAGPAAAAASSSSSSPQPSPTRKQAPEGETKRRQEERGARLRSQAAAAVSAAEEGPSGPPPVVLSEERFLLEQPSEEFPSEDTLAMAAKARRQLSGSRVAAAAAAPPAVAVGPSPLDVVQLSSARAPFLLQLPALLPLGGAVAAAAAAAAAKPSEAADALRSGVAANASESAHPLTGFDAQSPQNLGALPSGAVGVLRLRRSGRLELVLGDVVLPLDAPAPSEVHHEAAVLLAGRALLRLGPVAHRLTARLDADAFARAQ